MTKEFSRTDQLAAIMQQRISYIIQRKIKDPRVNQFVSVSAVKVTNDLSFAKVYITMIENDEKKVSEVIKVLNKAAGFIRTLLSREIRARKVPQLTFVYDRSIEYGNRLSQIIEELNADESEKDGEED